MQGLILYGPPASGKDTITDALSRAWPTYVPFQRLKVGKGKTTGYRMSTREDLDALSAAGEVLYVNRRYGNTYAVDRPALHAYGQAGQIPVLHLGQIEGIEAVTTFPAAWTRVLLWCPRQTTRERAMARGDQDVEERLGAWDETYADLAQNPETPFHLVIHTDVTPVDTVTRMIHATVNNPKDPAPVRALISIEDNS